MNNGRKRVAPRNPAHPQGAGTNHSYGYICVGTIPHRSLRLSPILSPGTQRLVSPGRQCAIASHFHERRGCVRELTLVVGSVTRAADGDHLSDGIDLMEVARVQRAHRVSGHRDACAQLGKQGGPWEKEREAGKREEEWMG